MHKSVLWAEDLESHRQPSLYYLSDEEGEDGPYLICDWNGSPTDFSEIHLDSYGMVQGQEKLVMKQESKQHEQNGHMTNGSNTTTATCNGINKDDEAIEMETHSFHSDDQDEFVDFPNPAAEILSRNGYDLGPPSHKQNDLDFDDCTQLDFLTVPPLTGGLLRRFVKSLMRMKSRLPQVETKDELKIQQ